MSIPFAPQKKSREERPLHLDKIHSVCFNLPGLKKEQRIYVDEIFLQREELSEQ